ncbi:MAG: TetR/AcrR family transcriptional regulator [Vicinamibacterales bacterium]
MGIKERHERDREAVRRAILDAARELFVTEGYGNVSIRKIAERIEYSPAAIYSYFPSKDDIFFALADEGFSRLGEVAHRDAEQLEALGPLERLREAAWRLYQFSCDHPQYFALMFVDRSVPRVSRSYECFTSARALRDEFLGHIQACITAGEFPAGTPLPAAFRLLTVGLLGVAAMRVSDRLGDGEDPDALARDVLNVTIAGLRSGIPLSSQAFTCPLDPPAEAQAS